MCIEFICHDEGERMRGARKHFNEILSSTRSYDDDDDDISDELKSEFCLAAESAY
jgi:hypothetical protein